MNIKTWNRIACDGMVTIIFGVILGFAFWMVETWSHAREPVVLLSATEQMVAELDYLPTSVQVQRAINVYGYGIAVDGIVGPETIAAWKFAEFDMLAAADRIDEQNSDP